MADTNAEYCSICGEPATAARHGDSAIVICATCAVDALPGLIADGAHLVHTRPEDRIKNVVLQVERNLWRGLALRLSREGKK